MGKADSPVDHEEVPRVEVDSDENPYDDDDDDDDDDEGAGIFEERDGDDGDGDGETLSEDELSSLMEDTLAVRDTVSKVLLPIFSFLSLIKASLVSASATLVRRHTLHHHCPPGMATNLQDTQSQAETITSRRRHALELNARHDGVCS